MSKRIILAISSLDMGGAQRVAMHIVRHWQARGHEVTILVTFYGRGPCRFEIPEGVGLIYLADLAPPGRVRLIDQARRLVALRQFLRSHAPDRVLAFLPDSNVAVLLASIGLGIGVVVSERNYPPRDVVPLQYRILRRLTYPRAVKVVLQSQKGVDWMRGAIPSARGSVIFNPVSLPLPTSLPRVDPGPLIPAQSRVILAVGRLVEAKQFDKLIGAFALIADRADDWRLAIVGDGPLAGALRAQVDRLGLRERVILPGTVGNPGDWYARAQVFAITSRYEGFPNVLLEAMAYGCACVALNCDTGPSDMISDRESGRLLPAEADEEDIGSALLELIKDEAGRNELGRRAAEVSARFSMASIMAEWDAVVLNERTM